MVAHVRTVSFRGIDVLDVDVQVHLASGIPAFTVVGLADKAVGESRERVRAALSAQGLSLPPKRIMVNLAPADLAKEGSHFDLPIALALLVAVGAIPEDAATGLVALGELGLDGRLRPVAGILPAAVHANALGYRLVCPAEQGREAAWAGGETIAASDLTALVGHLRGTQVLTAPLPHAPAVAVRYPDLSEIRGQETARRALEIAAAGGHNMLMIGPPGAGKSMLAARLPGILPPLTPSEALDVSLVQSVAGLLPEAGIAHLWPFREPHHSASLAALIGGGARAKPGEVSLAHRGILFLDELPEFQRAALESLRQPLKTGRAVVARANAHITYPARFQLVAAMNPCRCGHLSDPALACSKAPRCAEDYQARISGPLFDRIDLHVEVPAVDPADLSLPAAGESSAAVRARVIKARGRRRRRRAHHRRSRRPAAHPDLRRRATGRRAAR